MEELKDYSGEFNPDLGMEEFSKEALIKLWHASGNMYTSQAQCWHDVIEEKFGREVVEEIEIEMVVTEDSLRVTTTNPMDILQLSVNLEIEVPPDMRQDLGVGAGDLIYEGRAEGENRFIASNTHPEGPRLEKFAIVNGGE